MNGGLHHLHLRKRIYKNFEEFPNQKKVKRVFDYIMYGVSICAPIVLLPQVYQIYASGSVAGLSFSTWALFVGINLLWTAYGLIHRERLIVLSNFLMAILNFVVVCQIVFYN